MNKLASYTLLIVLFFFSACSQEDDDFDFGGLVVEDFSSNPVFTLTANNGNDVVAIQAGVELFYMFTEYEVDNSNVYSFIARFSKLSTCQANCEESLVIKIRDFQAVSNVDDLMIVSAITQGNYGFSSASSLDFSGISIEYTDSDGFVFKSDLAEQGPSSFFEVLSVDDYNINERGDPTKMLRVKFQCDLLDIVNGGEMRFTDGEATIAIAYPE